MDLQAGGLRFIITLLQMDFFSKVIMVVLLCFSIYSWTLIIEKFFKFKLLNSNSNAFERLFWSGESMENIYEKTKNSQKSPNGTVFVAAMQEYTASNVQEILKSNSASKKEAFKDRIYNSMIIIGRRSMKKTRKGLTFLFISSNISLFLGLLGTMWGIMQTFKTISLMKEANLATIAPGMSSSLITMITSMFCVIPSLAFYHIYSNKINDYEEELENFSLEVLNLLSKDL